MALVVGDVSARHGAFAGVLVVAGAASLVHAAVTWSLAGAIRFGLVAAGLAFVAELLVVGAGWLDHRLRPQVRGVPVAVLAGWIAATYVAYRVATLLVGPGDAPVVAATLATAADLVGDPFGVRAGFWEYTDRGPAKPRIVGVPWWNFVGWFLLTLAVATVGPPA